MKPFSANTWLAKLCATVFFVGLSPVAPGTVGTLAAIPLYYFFMSSLDPGSYMLVTIMFVMFAIFVSGRTAAAYGKEDPGEVVIDEVAGYFVTMAFLPPTWPSMIAGFLIFRVMDIVKPPPARQMERLPGGVGIVLDDVMAGFYANLVLLVMMRWVPLWT